VPEYIDVTLVGQGLAGEDPHRRRLAGAVWPEQPVAQPRRHLELEAVDGDDIAEPLDHAVHRHRGRTAHPDGGGGTDSWITTKLQKDLHVTTRAAEPSQIRDGTNERGFSTRDPSSGTVPAV
jgi:hypothetical protein